MTELHTAGYAGITDAGADDRHQDLHLSSIISPSLLRPKVQALFVQMR